MQGHTPKRPTGASPEALHAQSVWDKTHGPLGQFRNSSTVRVQKTAKGIFLRAAAAANASSAPQMYQITRLVNKEFFYAAAYDPFTRTQIGGEVMIAKSLGGRMPDSEVIDGKTITYDDYTSDVIRSATNSDLGYEWQVVHPRYAVGQVIYAQRVRATGISSDNLPATPDSNLTGQQIRMQEMQPDRAWSYQADQSGTPGI